MCFFIPGINSKTPYPDTEFLFYTRNFKEINLKKRQEIHRSYNKAEDGQVNGWRNKQPFFGALYKTGELRK